MAKSFLNVEKMRKLCVHGNKFNNDFSPPLLDHFLLVLLSQLIIYITLFLSIEFMFVVLFSLLTRLGMIETWKAELNKSLFLYYKPSLCVIKFYLHISTKHLIFDTKVTTENISLFALHINHMNQINHSFHHYTICTKLALLFIVIFSRFQRIWNKDNRLFSEIM